MSIQIESSDELEQLRARLRKMSDDELMRFGKAARSFVPGPKMPRHVQAPVRRGAWRVAAQASKGTVKSLSGSRAGDGNRAHVRSLGS